MRADLAACFLLLHTTSGKPEIDRPNDAMDTGKRASVNATLRRKSWLKSAFRTSRPTAVRHTGQALMGLYSINRSMHAALT